MAKKRGREVSPLMQAPPGTMHAYLQAKFTLLLPLSHFTAARGTHAQVERLFEVADSSMGRTPTLLLGHIPWRYCVGAMLLLKG